jgi:opacity protein-like surface antigen
MKKTALLFLVLSHFSCLFAQKSVFEIGVNYGKLQSNPVNFTSLYDRNWAMNTVVSNQYGLSVGHQFNPFYALRLGFNLERKGFSDSSIICSIISCFPYKNQLYARYFSMPLVNELHLFNHHLIFLAGLDASFLLGEHSFGLKKDIGLIAGLGTHINVSRQLKWRLEGRINRGLKTWHEKYSDFTFDGFKTYNVSTGLIYAFEKKK